MAMLDKLLDIGCAFDWITPTVAFVQDFFNGPVSNFGISPHAGWGCSDIKHLLNRNGVRVWGLMYNVDGDMLMFTVPKTQTKWAHYLLQREGIPLLYAPAIDINTSKSSNKKIDLSDPFESVFKFLDKLEKDIDL